MHEVAMKKSALLLAALALAVTATPALAQTPEQIAEAALREAPVWDGHNDVPIQLRGRFANMIGDFDFHDTSDTGGDGGSWRGRTMHTDIARLRKGQVGAQFWSVYVSAALPEPEAVQATIEQIDVTKRLVAQNPRDLELALTAADVERAMKRGRIASLMGIEGGHSIGSSLAVLRQMHDLGVRYMTLTHSKNTPWADSADDVPMHGGLSEFGQQVVREMNRIGMIVDLSHVNAEAMNAALDVARAPVIFSHSGALAVNGDSRNVPDDVLARLKDNGGIVMAIAYPAFVSEELRVWLANRKAEEARLGWLWQGQPEKVQAGMDSWDEANAMPPATVAQMADHIDHIRKVAGIDHIGIGGDYDGMATGPVGMEDVTGYPALFVELARRGYTKADLKKIASVNMMRVLKAVEAYGRSRRGDPPIETPVPN
jgi:membrane dipeptidase